MNQWRHVKVIEDPVEIGNWGIYIEGLRESVLLNEPAWLQNNEHK